MFFLSSILGAPVIDSAFEKVGVLKDVIAITTPHGYAPLKGIVIQKSTTREERIVPWHILETYSPHAVHLSSRLEKITSVATSPEDIFLKKDVLDQQIIDTSGARVVRVNDLQLGIVEGKTCIIAIDVSFKAIMRRLHIDSFDLFNWFPITLVDWRPVKLISGTIHLASLSKDLNHLHPADVANVIEELNVQQGSNILQSFDLATATKVIEEMEPEARAVLMEKLNPEKAAQISEKMPADELVDLLKDLTTMQKNKILNMLQAQKAHSIGQLMKYKDDTAGGLMNTDFIKVEKEWTVEKAIDEIRSRSPSFRSLHYIYVTDHESNFLGVNSLRRLIVASPQEKVGEVMRPKKELRTLKPNYSLKRVAAIMTKYNLLSIAVVEKNKMLGVVTVDDVMRALMPNA